MTAPLALIRRAGAACWRMLHFRFPPGSRRCSFEKAMNTYAFLILPSFNRVYADSAAALAQAELDVFNLSALNGRIAKMPAVGTSAASLMSHLTALIFLTTTQRCWRTSHPFMRCSVSRATCCCLSGCGDSTGSMMTSSRS